MAVFEVLATDEKLNDVLAFVDETLENLDAPMKVIMQMDLVVEEIFVNIAHYAYGEGQGMAKIVVEPKEKGIAMQFIDQGTPYNPLAKEDPDITLSAEERPIGGLGIFLVKKNTNAVSYAYENGSNILSIEKEW